MSENFYRTHPLLVAPCLLVPFTFLIFSYAFQLHRCSFALSTNFPAVHTSPDKLAVVFVCFPLPPSSPVFNVWTHLD